MAGMNGTFYDKTERDWILYVNGEPWRDDDGFVRHFRTAEIAQRNGEAAGIDCGLRVR